MGLLPRISPALLLLALGLPVAAQATFQDVGSLPGENGSRLWASACGGAGGVGEATAGGGSTIHAVRWLGTGPLEDLGDLPGGPDHSHATGLSCDGSVVVGGSDSASGEEAFRWSSHTGMVGLGDLAGGAFRSLALDVSGDGTWAVGFAYDQAGQQIVRWDGAGAIEALGGLPYGSGCGRAVAVNPAGDVIVGTADRGSDWWPVRWTAASGVQLLGDSLPGQVAGEAEGVSDDGQVVVGVAYTPTYIYPFRYTVGGSMVSLGYLPGGVYAAIAKDCSGDGSVVVGSNLFHDGQSGQYYNKATIWDPVNGLRALQEVLESEYGIVLPKWQLWMASGISSDGRVISGYGIDPHGRYRGFVVTLPGPCIPPVNYCSTAPNSAGSGAVMIWKGTGSVSANALLLGVQGAPPDKPALFFYGAGQTQVPFGDGFRCVAPPIFRLPAFLTSPQGTASFHLDVTAPPNPAGQIRAGETWNFQLWYRDPSFGHAGFNLSDGLEVLFCH